MAPRIRSIKPEFFKDELMGEMSRDLRLFYIGLWSHSDDEGRMRAHPAYVKAEIFPYDEDITAKTVPGMLQELSQRGRIVLYECSGQSYLWVRRFLAHQRIDKPSKSQLPPPPEGTLLGPCESIPATLQEPSRNPPGGLLEDSGEVAGAFPVGLEGKGVEGIGDMSAFPEKASALPERPEGPEAPKPPPLVLVVKAEGEGRAPTSKEPPPSEPRAELEDSALRVFWHWVRTFEKNANTVFRGDREKAVRARLKPKAKKGDGYTEAQLCRAIDGCKASPWHQGGNPEKRIIDELELICRDAVHVDKFLAIAESPADAETETPRAVFLETTRAK